MEYQVGDHVRVNLAPFIGSVMREQAVGALQDPCD